MKQPLRIAVLECDVPGGRTKEKFGGYGTIFANLLEQSADWLVSSGYCEARPQLDISKFDVVDHEIYPQLDKIDAVLLTGSKHNAFDNDPWILKLVEYIKLVLEQGRVRVIGVCFGHQIVGRAMDVKVDRSDVGWETAVTDVQLTERGKEVLGLDELRIHQMHHDIVYNCPENVELLGYSPRCEVQGMYSKDRLITVQGHPEFTSDIETEIIERRHGQGVFDDAMYEEAISRVKNHHDGVEVGAAFIRFLLED